MPDVTVVIPCYNYARFLAEAIDSAIYQTYGSVEVLVIDDGSTDGSAQIAERMGVRVLRQPNRGLAAARNRGIRAAHGDFIAFLDADDLWGPNKLELQIVTMRDRSVVLCHTDGVFLHGDGAEVRRARNRYPPERGVPLAHLMPGNRIFASSVMVRKETVMRAGMFDENLRHFEDTDLWFRLAVYGDFHFLDRRLIKYRVHGDNLSARGREFWEGGLPVLRDRVLADWDRIAARFEPGVQVKYRRLLRREIALCHSGRAKHLAREGKWWPAMKAHGAAVAAYPWTPRLYTRLLRTLVMGA